MRFEAITNEMAMSKLSAFIACTPAEKVAYVRSRSEVVRHEDLSDLSDQHILDSLVSLESRMQSYIDRFNKVKCAITPGLILDSDLIAKTNEFFNVAVPAGIESILQALEPGDGVTPAGNEELTRAIDTLFSDRQHMREQLELIYTSIKKPELVCEVIRTDARTYKKLYYPVLNRIIKGLEVPFALAFPAFLGIESCLLLHSAGLRVNQTYTPKVSGFSNEFLMYLMLHEVTHLLRYTSDTAYVFEGTTQVSDFDVYSMTSLPAENNHNADNYTVLILNALALMHKEGRIDLRNY